MTRFSWPRPSTPVDSRVLERIGIFANHYRRTERKQVSKKMTPSRLKTKVIGSCMILMLIVFTGVMPGYSAAETSKDYPQDRFVTIDFNNVDINVFIKFISELTGKNFIVDQRVRGNVTIISPTKISVAEAYKVFESVLEVHGFNTVQSGKVTKILPSPEARTSDIETRTGTRPAAPVDRLVTQLIP